MKHTKNGVTTQWTASTEQHLINKYDITEFSDGH